MKKYTSRLILLSSAITFATTMISIPNLHTTTRNIRHQESTTLVHVLRHHNPEPVAAAHVQRQEIAPEHYTGITRITDRLGDLIQHIGLPAITIAYGAPNPGVAFASAYFLNKHLFIPTGKKILRWPYSRLPIQHNPLHKDREISSWLYQATKNTCAHSYNQTVKIATSSIVPYLITTFILQAYPALIGKY